MQEELVEKKFRGNVVIQTYNPDHYSITCAKEQNYDMFYNKEIILRKQLNYPPFCDIIMVGISGKDEFKVEKVANSFYESIKKSATSNFAIYKPVPSPID